MAQIIDFETFKHARPPREAFADGDAEILFFLGVRYERMTDDSPAEPPRRSGTPRRKRKARG